MFAEDLLRVCSDLLKGFQALPGLFGGQGFVLGFRV